MTKKNRARTDLYDKYLEQYSELKAESTTGFNEYSKASYINGFLDGIDLLAGKPVDTYYHGLLAAKEVMTGEKPTVHFRL